MRLFTFCAVFILTGCIVFQAEARTLNTQSKYSGQESREIKSLSPSDIDALKNGKGWGLAKAAELNGIPGPKHLLEMKDEIGLSAAQEKKVEGIFKHMKAEAVPLGVELIRLEQQLEQYFSKGTITEKILNEQLSKIAEIMKQLRYTHLAAHLKTPEVLSSEQIVEYNRIRGYKLKSSSQHYGN